MENMVIEFLSSHCPKAETWALASPTQDKSNSDLIDTDVTVLELCNCEGSSK